MNGVARERLRVGFVGSGFIAEFHLKAMQGVRNVDVTGVYSRNADNRARISRRVGELGLGTCRSHESLESLVTADDVDAVWILSPNDTRLDVMGALHDAVVAGRSKVFAVACEKPLARTVPGQHHGRGVHISLALPVSRRDPFRGGCAAAPA